MKKKYLIISISILLVLTTCLYVFISDNNEKLIISSEENNKNILNTNALTMMYETGYQSGEYQVSSDTSWPQNGYTFNATLSRCENGSTLTWDDENKKVSIQANTSDKCYVYFDKLEILVDLNNYTFTWEPVDGATSYQILSNGELLTTTSSTSAEIYQYYNEPNTYNIVIQALDDTGKVLMESSTISYTIEKLSVDISGLGISKLDITYNNPSYGTVIYNDVYRISLGYPVNNYEVSNVIENLNYKINFINFDDFVDYFSYAGVDRANLDNVSIFFQSRDSIEFSNNFCINSDICNSLSLSNFTAYFSEAKTTYYYDTNSSKILVNCDTGSVGSAFFIQLVEPGKIASDWYILSFSAACVSSNTEVYIYDKKKKKLKKKKIKYIDYDDDILCWDFDNSNFTFAKPLWIKKTESTESYNLLKFSDGSILETINQHRIFNVEKGMFTYPMTDDTPIGTTTFNANGDYVTLVSKECINKKIDYYNIITDYHINFFANDILTSCRLSNMYPIENMKYVRDNIRDNGLDLSQYETNIIKGLRLKEQNMSKEEIDEYVNNLIKLMKK